MKAQSDALAEEVREVRRRMRARKVEKRKEGTEAGPHHDRERGQSRHRGGLPAGTKFVRGVPIPHVKLQHDHRYHNNSYPVNIGLGDTGNRAPSPSQDDVRRGEDNNLFAVDLSPPASPSIEDDDQSTGEYIPPRKFWYQQGRAGMHG
ncbi:uncharacterized protein P884DRAFT_252976 [Thermothelomyces heterothallicus CBS 202.75]|uniref:uncharacterized protein n=1 Tax=Thermothelomyces heterothallicus CBS 202.75 TaxID=1149848 RepID=UPI003742F5BD